MMSSTETSRRRSSSLLFGLCLAVIAALSAGMAQFAGPTAARAASDPGVTLLQSFAREAIAAQNSGSQERMLAAIQRYGDLTGIGHISLGEYASKLPRSGRPEYHSGMAKFMARFAMNASKHYRIAKADVMGPSRKNTNGYEVDSRIVLTDGSVYDVRWQLVKRGSSLRILDAQVYGFWMTPFQRDLFVDYVAKAGGNVKALVLALNQ